MLPQAVSQASLAMGDAAMCSCHGNPNYNYRHHPHGKPFHHHREGSQTTIQLNNFRSIPYFMTMKQGTNQAEEGTGIRKWISKLGR